MIKILMVCHGNICRSPMAEFILKDMIRGTEYEGLLQVDSAATSTEELGNPVYPPAREILSRHGISCKGKYARQISLGDYDNYDCIIGMDEWNRRNLIRMFKGDPDNKISLIMDYTNRPGDVSDPWYTRDFATTYRDIEEGCQGILRKFTKQGLI